MRCLLALAILALFTGSARAGETPWQEIAPEVEMRLISTGKIKPDGTTLIALEINMPENTKTYWRIPGDTGFPAELDFSSSTGVEDHAVHWPFPKRDQTADYLDYVYYGPTVLPVELQLTGDAPELKLHSVLGVCSDICVPAQASFSMPLANSKPDSANGLRIKQAMALAPIEWPQSEQAFGDVIYDATQGELRIPVMSSAVDLSSLIVTAPDGSPHYGTPQKSPEPNLVVVPVLDGADEFSTNAQSVQLTFMTDEGSFETTRTIEFGAAGL
ncbi:protein-disulfide reductase DsbD domain-containing protein [Devosia submarina]|uniref:protein-disulfide reductase DsbD domain-containing protein n=1 Tax=Devosia submarina TaxID=1173082 RepID=UPI0013003F3D|nr:protein-disulfide reductase DsbD domain-containing protein [Devosia submarina]